MEQQFHGTLAEIPAGCCGTVWNRKAIFGSSARPSLRVGEALLPTRSSQTYLGEAHVHSGRTHSGDLPQIVVVERGTHLLAFRLSDAQPGRLLLTAPHDLSDLTGNPARALRR